MEAYIKVKPRLSFSLLTDASRMLTLSGDLGGVTLTPGLYKATDVLMIQKGDLTLDAHGNENAVWVFRLTAAFRTWGGAGGNVILRGGAKSKNVFWQTDCTVKIGEGTSFKGNILAKMNDLNPEVNAEPTALKYRAVKTNFTKEFDMGWPLYGQRL